PAAGHAVLPDTGLVPGPQVVEGGYLEIRIVPNSLSPPDIRRWIHFRLMQELSRLLRWYRVDVEAGAPLEAGHARQTGNDLHVPVVVRQILRVERRRVDDVVVRRLVQRLFQLQQDRLQHGAQL